MPSSVRETVLERPAGRSGEPGARLTLISAASVEAPEMRDVQVARLRLVEVLPPLLKLLVVADLESIRRRRSASSSFDRKSASTSRTVLASTQLEKRSRASSK